MHKLFNCNVERGDFLRISTSSLWLTLLLPLLFISDVLYGLISFYGVTEGISPGYFFRGVVVLISVYSVIMHYSLIAFNVLLFLFALFFFALPSLVNSLFVNDYFFDFVFFAKIMYMPMIVCLFMVIFQKYRVDIDYIICSIERVSYVLCLGMLVPVVFGIEQSTYGSYAFGIKGVFNAQNDLTLTFGLALLAGAFRLTVVRFSLHRFVLFVLSVFACSLIGTRASILIMLGVCLSPLVWIFWGKLGVRRFLWRKYFILSLFLVTLLSMLFYAFNMQEQYAFQSDKLLEIATGEHPRAQLLSAGALHIIERDIYFDLFGEGADVFQQGVARKFLTHDPRRMVEVDLIDIFGSFGFLFVLLLYLFVICILFFCIYKFITKRCVLHGLIGSASLLYIANSVLAGHSFTSPMPSTVLSAYLAIFLVFKRLKI